METYFLPDDQHLPIVKDLNAVYRSFVNGKSIRFEQFAQCWREHRMSMLCSGRGTLPELMEFWRECYSLVWKFLLSSPDSIQARVFCLYSLYALYYMYPYKERVKIRTTDVELGALNRLADELQTDGHLDAVFVYNKLRTDKAFVFCCSQIDYNLDRYSEWASVSTGSAGRNGGASSAAAVSEGDRISELISSGFLESISKIHEKYTDLKYTLCKNGALQKSLVDFASDTLLQQVTKRIATYDEWKSGRKKSRRVRRESATSGSDSEVDSESDVASELSHADSIRNRRMMIRQKAYGGQSSSSRWEGDEATCLPAQKQPRQEQASASQSRLNQLGQQFRSRRTDSHRLRAAEMLFADGVADGAAEADSDAEADASRSHGDENEATPSLRSRDSPDSRRRRCGRSSSSSSSSSSSGDNHDQPAKRTKRPVRRAAASKATRAQSRTAAAANVVTRTAPQQRHSAATPRAKRKSTLQHAESVSPVSAASPRQSVAKMPNKRASVGRRQKRTPSRRVGSNSSQHANDTTSGSLNTAASPSRKRLRTSGI